MWELQNPKIGSDKALALRKRQQKKSTYNKTISVSPGCIVTGAQMQQCAKGKATISSPDKLPWECKN